MGNLKNQVKKPLGLKLVSREKLQNKGTLDDNNPISTIAMALKAVTNRIPIEEQKINTFLINDVFSNPKFKKDNSKYVLN